MRNLAPILLMVGLLAFAVSGCKRSSTWTRPTDGMQMVYAPAGEFTMGTTDEEIDHVVKRQLEMDIDDN